MKKGLLLNGPLSRLIAHLGHGDGICIGDAGLPVPGGVERIDLAISAGLPPFLETLSAVTSEMYVERALIAAELAAEKPEFHGELSGLIGHLAKNQGNEIGIGSVAHEDFKKLTRDCKAVVRTGECTPYANIILYAGVTF